MVVNVLSGWVKSPPFKLCQVPLIPIGSLSAIKSSAVTPTQILVSAVKIVAVT